MARPASVISRGPLRTAVPAPRYRLRPARASDAALLVEHRHRMFTAIGGRPEAEITAHDGRYRRWLLARMRRGELIGVIAETYRGAPVASGCLWYRPDQPRPENPRDDTAPYILSMFTEPEHRGRGLAGKIVRALIAEAKRAGHWQVILHAAPPRPLRLCGAWVRTALGGYWIDRSRSAAHPRATRARPATRAGRSR